MSEQDKRIAPGDGTLGFLRGIVERDIERSGRNCSTMIRAGLLLDILDELEVRRRDADAPKVPS